MAFTNTSPRNLARKRSMEILYL